MKKLLALVVLVAVAGGAALYIFRSSPPWFERVRYPLRYAEYVRVHAHEHGLDPALVAAVIYQESKFRSDSKSSSGAIGLMQVTPATAEVTGAVTRETAEVTGEVDDAAGAGDAAWLAVAAVADPEWFSVGGAAALVVAGAAWLVPAEAEVPDVVEGRFPSSPSAIDARSRLRRESYASGLAESRIR